MSIQLQYYFENLDKFPIAGFFDDMKQPCDILHKAKTYLKSEITDKNVMINHGKMMSDDAHFYGNYFIDEGTVIYNNVTIIGPVYIGKNCEIMPGAVIRPNSIIGDGCAIGHGCEIKHCVLFNGSKVASLAFTGDSVLGASARVGSGVITANRKFNQSTVTIKLGDVRHDLGDSFFGCILGDSSRIGANSVTQPGTHIGPHTWIYPMTTVRGFIPREKRVHHTPDIVFEENEIIELKP